MVQIVSSDEKADVARCNARPGFQHNCTAAEDLVLYLFIFLGQPDAEFLHSLCGIWRSLNVCGSQLLMKKVTSVSARTEGTGSNWVPHRSL